MLQVLERANEGRNEWKTHVSRMASERIVRIAKVIHLKGGDSLASHMKDRGATQKLEKRCEPDAGQSTCSRRVMCPSHCK